MGSSTVIPLVFILLILKYGTIVTEGLQFATNGHPSNVNVIEGESAQFHCLFTGFEQDTVDRYVVKWEIEYHDKKRDTLTDGVDTGDIQTKYAILTSSTLEKSTLIIRNVSTAEQSRCRCHVSGGNAELTSAWGYLSVLLKPGFRQMPSDKSIDEGQNVTLRCHLEIVDLSFFQVRWFRNGELVSRNYDTLYMDSEFHGEITVHSDRDLGMFDLLIIDFKQNGTFYCDVYLTGQNRVVLQSDMARIVVRDSRPVATQQTLVSAEQANTKASEEQPSDSTQKCSVKIITVSVIVSIVNLVAIVTVCVGYKAIRHLKRRKESKNLSGSLEENGRRVNAESCEGESAHYQEMLYIKNEKYENLNPITESIEVDGESPIYEPFDDDA